MGRTSLPDACWCLCTGDCQLSITHGRIATRQARAESSRLLDAASACQPVAMRAACRDGSTCVGSGDATPERLIGADSWHAGVTMLRPCLEADSHTAREQNAY